MRTLPLVIIFVTLAAFVSLVLVGSFLNGPKSNPGPNTTVPTPTPIPAEPADLASSMVKQKADPVCPNSGTYAPLPGTCKNKARAALSGNSTQCPSTSTGVQCSHMNVWSISQFAAAPHTLSANLDDVNMFSFTVGKTSAGNTLSSSLSLILLNNGDCPSNLASIVVILDQSLGSQTTGNSYGPSGKNFKLWATSGTENPTTAGLCGTPGQAQICYSSCNISVPFVENTITNLNTNAPLDLSTVVVPAKSSCTDGAVDLNLGINFAVSDAILAQMNLNRNNYRLNVLITFDACCDRGSSCGINIDCKGPTEIINTFQYRSGLFSLPSACTENCGSVKLLDQAVSITTNNTDLDCLADISINNNYPTATSISSGFTGTITGDESCDTSSCDCVGTGKYFKSLGNQLSLAPDVDACVNPITGASLLPSTPTTATHQFYCPYPLPVNCQVSLWSDWVDISTCDAQNCSYTSKRTRTVTVPPCHGGSACPALEDYKYTDCSTSCTYLQNAASCTNGTCSLSTCQLTRTCTTQPDAATYCDAGLQKTCSPQVIPTPLNCSASSCSYSSPAVCQPPALPCDYASCLQELECDKIPDGISYCSNGERIICPIVPVTQSVNCSLPCRYSAWGDWAAWSTCDCVHNQTRLRTRIPEQYCPQSELNTACHDITDSESQECTCPSPTPTPTPTPMGCGVDTACTYSTEPDVCTPTSGCNVNTCTQANQCSYPSLTPTQCLNNQLVSCSSQIAPADLPCALDCQYSEWGAWEPVTDCVDIGNNLCAMTMTHTRTPVGVCPSFLLNTCTNTTEFAPFECTCPTAPVPVPSPMPTPSPTPSPIPPPPECIYDSDCNVNLVNLCAEMRMCVSGVCLPSGIPACTPPADLCQVSICDPLTGQCSVQNRYCNDNNACTSDYCNATSGACYHVNRTYGPTISPCTEAICNPTTGTFTIQTKQCPSGTYCSSMDPDGLCRPPCNASTDCSWIAPTNSLCNRPICDYGFCTTTICPIGGGYTCDPEVGCIPDCSLSVCLPGYKHNSTCGCVPDLACNGTLTCPSPYTYNNDTCACKCQITCPIGLYLDYSDCSCKCNALSCDSHSTSCVWRQCDILNTSCLILNNTICDDHDACTIEPYATCADSPTGRCVHNPLPSVFGDICQLSGCDRVTGPYSVNISCADNTSLTQDFCNPYLSPDLAAGCNHIPVGCNDNNVCTEDAVDPLTWQCTHTHIDGCCNTNADCASGQTCTLDASLGYSVCVMNNTLVVGTFTPPCNNTITCTSDAVCAVAYDGGVCSNGWCTSHCFSGDRCNPKGKCFGGQYGKCQRITTCLDDGCFKAQCTLRGCEVIPRNDLCPGGIGTVGACGIGVNARLSDTTSGELYAFLQDWYTKYAGLFRNLSDLMADPCPGNVCDTSFLPTLLDPNMLVVYDRCPGNHCAICSTGYTASAQAYYLGCVCPNTSP